MSALGRMRQKRHNPDDLLHRCLALPKLQPSHSVSEDCPVRRRDSRFINNPSVIVIGSMERYAVHYSASTALSRVIAAGRVGSTTECTVLGQLAPRVVDAALHLLAHFS